MSKPVFLASMRCFELPYGACYSASHGCSAQLTGLKYFPTLKAQLNNTSFLKPPQPLKQNGSPVWMERLDAWRPVAGLGFYFESLTVC